jgi:hypothetical protein
MSGAAFHTRPYIQPSVTKPQPSAIPKAVPANTQIPTAVFIAATNPTITSERPTDDTQSQQIKRLESDLHREVVEPPSPPSLAAEVTPDQVGAEAAAHPSAQTSNTTPEAEQSLDRVVSILRDAPAAAATSATAEPIPVDRKEESQPPIVVARRSQREVPELPPIKIKVQLDSIADVFWECMEKTYNSPDILPSTKCIKIPTQFFAWAFSRVGDMFTWIGRNVCCMKVYGSMKTPTTLIKTAKVFGHIVGGIPAVFCLVAESCKSDTAQNDKDEKKAEAPANPPPAQHRRNLAHQVRR